VKPGKETLEALLALPPEEADRILSEMDEGAIRRFLFEWPAWVHLGQEPPDGGDWRICLMLGGRSFGKTRAGAEWISQKARDHPGASIALVAANVDEARRLMVEGPRSGLLAVARPGEALLWEPSRKRLEFAAGAVASLYSGAHADSLRGFEHHFAWCDELAKWKQAQGAWDNLMLGLRLGDNPQALVTTTPRPIAALRAIIGGEGMVRAGGPSAANPHNSPRWLSAMERQHQGTTLGRQELGGELLEDLQGALWPRALIEERRSMNWNEIRVRTVIGVDPPASVDGTCGIIVCGLANDGNAYVLADLSASGLSPDGWARKVAAAWEAWGADLVVAEKNNGGAMVETVLRGANVNLPVRLVHAAEGKVARAAPVAALFESGRAWFAGRFPELEEELCGLTWDGRYVGPGTSPDRADAMVWAMTELMLGPRQAEPRIVML